MGEMIDNYRPAISESRCHVCQSDMRLMVDKMGAFGYRPTAIARYVQEFDPALNRKSIERHLKRHVDFEQRALQEILEERAREAGILAEEGKSRLITRAAILDRIIERGWEQISDPNAKIPIEFLLKATELQKDFEDSAAQALTDQYQRQLQAIIQAVREIVPPDLHPALAARAQQIFEAPALAELEPGS